MTARILGAAAMLALAACGGGDAGCVLPACETVRVTVGDALSVEAEIADEPAERARGLRRVPSLPDDRGMLFLFPGTSTRTFTMADVLIPLDLVVIRDGRVVQIVEMVPCEGVGCLYDTFPADAALEIRGGLARELGLSVGDPITAGDLLR